MLRVQKANHIRVASESVTECGKSRCREPTVSWEVFDENWVWKMINPQVCVSERIADFCRRHQIRRLSFFGSVLREDFNPESDVDVLVEFEPGAVIGFRIFDIEAGLSELLGGRKIDLVNPKYLNPRLRDRILASAEVFYAAG